MAPSSTDYGYYKLRKLDPIIWWAFILCVKGVVYLVDIILRLCFDYSVLNGSKLERDKSHLYEHSAHMIKIYGRGTISLFGNHNETNFLYLHDKYVNPSYILEHDNVSLMGIDNKRAYFCVSKDNVDPYSSSTGPFLWANTFIAAEKQLIIDLQHFHTLADIRGDPFEKDNLKITIIQMTTRCGSTLIGQVLERVPRTRVMSEPKSFSYIGNLYLTGYISYIEYQNILQSAFRLQCKKEKDVDHIVIKWLPSATPLIPSLKKKYPNINLIFNTRNIKATARSIHKIFDTILPFSMLLCTAINMMLFAPEHVPIHYEDLKWWKIYRGLRLLSSADAETAKFLFFNWWGNIEMYLKNRNNYTMTILYEDLCDNSEKVIITLFQELQIPLDCLENAMKAFQVDSQQGLFGKRGGSGKRDGTETCRELDIMLKHYDVPVTTDITLEEFKNLLAIRE